ncbi:hypothetical protein BZA70DRAFT_280438 [Myxozyma melibiosi]|uniref:C2H2-type domain-containing protein n=1 Tax=Myxozyma melibiosi TaxID=54550 RepID=A0ABR1F371_9ASCO
MAKRDRSPASDASSPDESEPNGLAEHPPLSPNGSAISDISEDTLGSVPGSPGVNDDNLDQVTVCRWEGCFEDCGNMDNLVKHIHDEHVGNRRPKYACEWQDCPRRGLSQTSRFALVAHMRSHTGEKPFYCNVPECDRSFTRSDALAKHMRTVHEAEAIREAIPKTEPSGPPKMSSKTAEDYESVLRTYRARERELRSSKKDEGEAATGADDAAGETAAGNEDGLDGDESQKPQAELARYLKRKLAWAGELHGQLQEELDRVNKLKEDLWTSKELLLEKVIVKELGEEEASKIVH